MKPAGIIGIILIILGVAALAYRGVPYAEQHKAEIGPLRVTATEERTFPIPPIVSIIVIAGGVALLVTGLRKG
jgi:uncharacterized membrane protein